MRTLRPHWILMTNFVKQIVHQVSRKGRLAYPDSLNDINQIACGIEDFVYQVLFVRTTFIETIEAVVMVLHRIYWSTPTVISEELAATGYGQTSGQPSSEISRLQHCPEDY